MSRLKPSPARKADIRRKAAEAMSQAHALGQVAAQQNKLAKDWQGAFNRIKEDYERDVATWERRRKQYLAAVVVSGIASLTANLVHLIK